MSRWLKLVGGVLGLGVLVLAAVALALQYWVSSDDFRSRLEREASAALGVPVRLGRVDVDLWPLPAVGLDKVAIRSQPPVTLDRVEARPVWLALLAGRLEIATLVVRKAVVPEQAVAVVSAAMLQKRERSRRANAGLQANSPLKQGWWPRRARFDEISWVDTRGITTTVDAQAALGDDGLPVTASVKVLRGRLAGSRATLKRVGDPWTLNADIGGGKVIGSFALRPADRTGSALLLGNFETTNVEVSALTAPSRTLSGRIYAKSTLRAQLRDLGGLAEALQTQTQFTVRNAVLHGVDLQQAVRTVGLSRGGNTALDSFTGRVSTQGKAVHLTNLAASSGSLSATGDVAMAANKTLSGHINASLGGALAVPLVVAGTVDDPSLTMTRSGLVGAGAAIGQGLRGLFGR